VVQRGLRLAKHAFKTITIKQILAHIRPGDWFIAVDMKDALSQAFVYRDSCLNVSPSVHEK